MRVCPSHRSVRYPRPFSCHQKNDSERLGDLSTSQETPASRGLATLVLPTCPGLSQSLSFTGHYFQDKAVARWHARVTDHRSPSSGFFAVHSLGDCELRRFKEKRQCGESSLLSSPSNWGQLPSSQPVEAPGCLRG